MMKASPYLTPKSVSGNKKNVDWQENDYVGEVGQIWNTSSGRLGMENGMMNIILVKTVL